ncbi:MULTISPECIES: MmgE/PrpD family protein [unclassified Modicisalibacter]|uniref:MmgE/PrpD family protein n=1 Tax=unclassified Modicisalibacter TaxID=2679913 RepID=UPI001CCB8603|nr:MULTISPECIES: MmgE/PrpD family protein [unclassified Modicisalibacter]MBZ9556451.1 MmgE/PrpD family protein [Modicisalibacter sp. R2A 31.J]MBZ9575080.1 MmgE/PrpD family protein [Modicisalibacter sp. MOD 31.J]
MSPLPFDWIQDFNPESLDDAHYRHARRCLLDLLGVAAGATRTPLATIAERFVTAQHGGDRPLLFSTARASSTGVALHGGWLIDALDAHDGQVLTKGHAGVAVLPGLLALPEVEALSGKALLGWLTLGYEIATRAGIALHDTACDYHTSGAWNALGVAAIASRLFGLDASRLREALGIAEFYGPRSQMMRCIDHPTMVKDGSGWGAMTGVSAALLAREGFTGAPAVTLTDAAVEPIWVDLGQRWYLFEQYFKAYPVCRWAQPAVEAVLELVDGSFAAQDIARIEIDTFHEAKRLHTVHPADTEQAQYSLPWPVACAVYFGTVDVHGITAALTDPTVRDIAARVETREDATFNARFPAERWARARLQLNDGRVLESTPREARGNPTNPLADAELEAKFHALAEPALGRERATAIRHAVETLETRPASDLLALL